MGREIGGLRTLLGLLLGLVFGALTLRLAGTALLPELARTLQLGHAPMGVLWRTGRRFLAGLLLIFPGFFSDALALILLLWPSSRARPLIPPAAGEGEVIEGDWRRESGPETPSDPKSVRLSSPREP